MTDKNDAPELNNICVGRGGNNVERSWNASSDLSPPLEAKSLRLLYVILANFDLSIKEEELAWILPILERHYNIGPEHMIKWNKMSTMQGYKNFRDRFYGRDAFADGPFQEQFRVAVASHYLHHQKEGHTEWNAFFFAAAAMGSFLLVPDLNRRSALFADWIVYHWQACQWEKIWTDHHIRFINTLIGFANVRAYGLTPGITRLLSPPNDIKKTLEPLQNGAMRHIYGSDGDELKKYSSGDVVSDSKRVQVEPAIIGLARDKIFKKFARKAFDELSTSEEFVDQELVTQKIQELAQTDGQAVFEEEEVVAGYEKMSDENAIMCSKGRIYRI